MILQMMLQADRYDTTLALHHLSMERNDCQHPQQLSDSKPLFILPQHNQGQFPTGLLQCGVMTAETTTLGTQ